LIKYRGREKERAPTIFLLIRREPDPQEDSIKIYRKEK